MFNDGDWVIGGDFNTIKERRDRKGRLEVLTNNEIKSFADFIQNSSLVDLPSKGKQIYMI